MAIRYTFVKILISLKVCSYTVTSGFIAISCAKIDTRLRNISKQTSTGGDRYTSTEYNSDSASSGWIDFDTAVGDVTGFRPDTSSTLNDEAETDTDASWETDIGTGSDKTVNDDTETNREMETDTAFWTNSDSASERDTGTEKGGACDDMTPCNDDDECCPSNCTLVQDNDCYMRFDYVPSNFDPETLTPNNAAPLISLNCDAVLDSSGTATFVEWCGQKQPPVFVNTLADPETLILTFANFKIANTGSLTLRGNRPVILAVFGDATINGTLDASASDTLPGAGGSYACEFSMGGNGTGRKERWIGASGGGGGGFGTSGGTGGVANVDNNKPVGLKSGGRAGTTRGNSDLVPLLGGCPGGEAGDCTTPGGAGGGAVQISAAGSLIVNGTIRANGGNGAPGCGEGNEEGGTGGGSGGGILLEASFLNKADATIEAKGGSGGLNGEYCGIHGPHCRITSGGKGADTPGIPGDDGTRSNGGGPGGGGGYGRIVTMIR